MRYSGSSVSPPSSPKNLSTVPPIIETRSPSPVQQPYIPPSHAYTVIKNHIMNQPSTSRKTSSAAMSPFSSLSPSSSGTTTPQPIPTPTTSSKYFPTKIPDYSSLYTIYLKNDMIISEEDFVRAMESWNIIVNSKTPPFIINSGMNTIHESNCVLWFVHVFENKLMDDIILHKPYRMCNNHLLQFIEFLLEHKHKSFVEIKKFIVEQQQKHRLTYQDYLYIKDALILTLCEILGLSPENEIIKSWGKIYDNFLYIAFTTYI